MRSRNKKVFIFADCMKRKNEDVLKGTKKCRGKYP